MKQLLNDLKNPKKKSIALLIIYAIFFAFVALLTRTSIANTPAVSSKEKSINSYEYNYIINDNENIKEVNGKYSNNSDNFIYNGLNYYKDKSGIYLDNNFVEIDFDVDLYKYDKMEKLIQNSEFVEKTTYKDGREKTIYSISIDKYFDFMQQINSCDTKDCSLINANITVDKLEYINSILIDLSNYYDYQYLINIKYFNINTN